MDSYAPVSHECTYNGFAICSINRPRDLVSRYYLINRAGEWDHYQIPFSTLEAAKTCIDKMNETGEEAFYLNNEVVYIKKE